MKQLENIFRTFFVAVFMLIGISEVSAQERLEISMDSVEISLITCSPHEEVYSLYGHTALRYHELQRGGRDMVFNYGVFDYKKPHFVLRFIFGLTDYELGVLPFKLFCDYYRHWGSQVSEQVINLTDEEKMNVTRALFLNLRPENKVYRYNFFYDNCSTRPRNILEHNINGEVIYAQRENFEPSYREMIHELSRNHEWNAFGIDMLLGLKADRPTTLRQQEFLPANLQYDFDRAQIYKNGEYRPLVSERRTLVKPGVQMIERDFPISPLWCFVILFAVSVAVLVAERRRKKCFAAFDIFLVLLTSLPGLILFLMIFSQHPTTSMNLQILLFNPLYLFFLRSLVKNRTKTRFWTLMNVSVTLFILCSLWQDYAEGTEILALCLLSRNWSHLKNDK